MQRCLSSMVRVLDYRAVRAATLQFSGDDANALVAALPLCTSLQSL